MFKTRSQSAFNLSTIIAVLALVAAAGGLFIDDLYQDNYLVTSAFYGNDLVTLVVAVPLLVAAMILAKRGSQRAQLVWLGMLVYMAYNFAFYLFGAAFNSLFLIYVALFAVSVFTILILLRALDTQTISERFQAGPLIKWISGYMLLVGLFLGGFHIALSLGYVFTGDVPELIVMLDHPTNLIAALDLSLVVPLHLLSAIWLWQRRAWGYLLATIINVQSAVYNLALVAGVVSEVRAGAADDLSEGALWGILATVGLVFVMLLLRSIRTQESMALVLQP